MFKLHCKITSSFQDVRFLIVLIYNLKKMNACISFDVKNIIYASLKNFGITFNNCKNVSF